MAASKKARGRPAELDMRDLSRLGANFHGGARAAFGSCASLCFRHATPRGPLRLDVSALGKKRQRSLRTHRITKAIRSSYADMQDATEHGAYAVSLLVAAVELGATVAERAYKGHGFDWLLTPPGSVEPADPDDIFAGKWALESSGTLKGGLAAIRARVREKRAQVTMSAHLLPTLVGVVEFSLPAAVLELV